MKKNSLWKLIVLLAAIFIALSFYELYKQRSGEARATVSAIEHALAQCPDKNMTCRFESSHAVYRIQELESKRSSKPQKILAGEVLLRVEEMQEGRMVIKKIIISPEGEIRSALLAGTGITHQVTLSHDDPQVIMALADFRARVKNTN